MRVLVACEYSGRVRDAFRKRGHDAWSCDLLPAEDGSAHHFEGDVRDCMAQQWDLMIAHPPCTHLAVSGARHFAAKRADGRQQEAIEFFMWLANLPIPRICIENPVCIMSSHWRKPDQTIQPWMFGHPERKATCLWIKGLPKLVATDDARPKMAWMTKAQTDRVHHLPPSPDRWKERSRTYTGVAEAMAEQWGNA